MRQVGVAGGVCNVLFDEDSTFVLIETRGGEVACHGHDCPQCVASGDGRLSLPFLADDASRGNANRGPEIGLEHQRAAAGVLFVENVGSMNAEGCHGAGARGALNVTAEVLHNGHEDPVHPEEFCAAALLRTVDLQHGAAAGDHLHR